MGRPRIDNFVGSSQAYVGYLEDKLLSLRYHHRQCLFFETQPDATSSALTTEQAHCNESQFDVHEAPSTKSAQVPGHTRGQKRKNGSTALEDPPPGFENSKWHKKYSEIVRNDSEAPSEATHNQPLFLTWPSNWKQDHDCVQSRLRWKNIVQHLVSITPKGKGWWEAIRNLGAYEGTCNSRATLFLLDNGQSYQDAVPGMGSTRPMSDYESPLLHHIANIASTATGRGKAAELTLALANFQKFLVLCSCVVLQHSKAPTDRIYDIVKICAGNISEDYCQRLLRTVVYLNKMIDTLDSNGWINRASELLLLWSKPVSYFYPLVASQNDSLEYLNTALTSKEFMVDTREDSSWKAFFVPSLVYMMLQKQYSLATISRILQYQRAEIFDDLANPWALSNGF